MYRSAIGIFLALAVLLPCSTSGAADAALIEAARKEGKVVWYTTLIVNQVIRPLKTAFERQYPGIELQYARADESPTAAKILEEGVAGAAVPSRSPETTSWAVSLAPAKAVSIVRWATRIDES